MSLNLLKQRELIIVDEEDKTDKRKRLPYKKAKKQSIIREQILKYVTKYPGIVNNLISNENILALCLQIEKHCHDKSINKKELLISVIEMVMPSISCDNKRNAEEIIDFLFMNDLIKVNYLVKLYYRFLQIF